MGRQRRPQPKYLAKKLKQIRLELGLGQAAMAKRLGNVPSNPDGAIVSDLNAENVSRICL